jgi:cob(I)alamin adenosyltransferase
MGMPANLFALLAGVVASVALGDWVPLAAAGGGSLAYLALLAAVPGFRRAVRANLDAQGLEAGGAPRELDDLLAELAPSQREHYRTLKGLRDDILARYARVPGGRVLAASSAPRLDALLTSFLRLVSTLNGYRRFLGAADRLRLEEELKALEADLAAPQNEKLKDVKARRVELLQKRVQRYQQAAESREVVSHQLASIEDLLRLTYEQSIAVRDPELVSRQLEALTAEVAATEDTVQEMEQFMHITEEFSSSESLPSDPVRVR